ncbi:hypothetical protein FRC10_001151 [Ceratobasidium sp. 414]|nr:hypothetical protein FRC10_001151 [Ceratobasidium sp. 414]
MSVIPPVIEKIMESGWSTHFSLALVDPAFLKQADAAQYAKIVIGLASSSKTADRLAIANTPARVKAEENMSFNEWRFAFDNLMLLIEKYRDPDSITAWQNHWYMVFSHHDVREKWPCLMKYNTKIHQMATQFNFNMGIWQHRIYDEIVDQDREDITARRFTAEKDLLSPSVTNQPNQLTEMTSASSAFAVASTTTTKPSVAQPPSKPTGDPLSFNAPATAGPSAMPRFASPSTPSKVAPPPHVPTLPTYAPSANPPITGRKRACSDPRQVSTLLLPDKWESELRALGLWERFSDVPDGLRHGFRIGADHPVTRTYTPDNHKSATLQPQIIRAHIQTKLAASRYTGPFSRGELEHLIGPFQSAPLGVVEKSSSPSSFRIIQDFSFSAGSDNPALLNSQIDPGNFPCIWGSFDKVAATIIPIHPIDQPHIVFKWEDKFYIDSHVPFGAASSNGLFARCRDSIAEMYFWQGFGIIHKWVDDFLFIQSPHDGSVDNNTPPHFSIAALYTYALLLGWPWKHAKTHPFAALFRYLGFDWDIPNRSMSIPDPKRKKYLARLREWLARDKVCLKTTESLVGSLVHCSLVIPDGRPHLAALIRFMAALPRDHGLRFRGRPINDTARADANWWVQRLSVPHTGMSIAPPPPDSNLQIYTDASTSHGLGIIVDNKFIALRLSPDWKRESRDIGWAEAIAVKMAVTWLTLRGEHNTSITINCDNQGVVYAWLAGRSRNPQQNSAIACTAALAATHSIHLSILYIHTEDNPADAPSRNIHPIGLTWAAQPPPIPEHLSEFIAYTDLHTMSQM